MKPLTSDLAPAWLRPSRVSIREKAEPSPWPVGQEEGASLPPGLPTVLQASSVPLPFAHPQPLSPLFLFLDLVSVKERSDSTGMTQFLTSTC